MAKKFSYLILILSILFLTIIIFLIKESEFTSTTVKDITVTSCSFFTLILAILLYDRFDYRKVVFQRKLEVVLNLLVDLKSFTFYAKYINTDYEYNIGFEIERVSLKKKFNSEHLDKIISFNENYHKRLYEKISLYITNPFLPKKIGESLKFLYMRNNHSINHIPDFEVIRLFFNDELPINLETLWYIESSNTITLKSYIENYIICLDIIENWINEHSNIKADLNI
ncbi:hypothetical protein [Flavobacterium sp. LM4]|uniref:hypothetical protein n=1 Tax=Flavobacterium sp. LM4 TaxID=1938609 RepID=UPI000992CB56|nr:hypothetical protein [Flavobacterium sp. LM4]OOV16653.1 hypothetical protein BXU10_21130 [Flavobacterium sp. LM4]